MRVCLVSYEYPPETADGGIGTQTWNKAHGLTRLGHDVEVLTCVSRGARSTSVHVGRIGNPGSPHATSGRSIDPDGTVV